jgi:hypothetical protein
LLLLNLIAVNYRITYYDGLYLWMDKLEAFRMTKISEQRKAKRYRLEMPAELRFKDEGADAEGFADALDIGGGI